MKFQVGDLVHYRKSREYMPIYILGSIKCEMIPTSPGISVFGYITGHAGISHYEVRLLEFSYEVILTVDESELGRAIWAFTGPMYNGNR